MTARGWGRVVFVSSESAVNIPKEILDYGMTKTAQLAVSRGFAEAVAGTGVTVNAVLPGPTRSEILGDFMAKQAEAQGMTQDEAERGFLTAMRPTSLLGRFATTDEVRSEEHTSELQSLMRISYAVFCLNKKKNAHEEAQER